MIKQNELIERNYTIDILKFIAIFLVVLGHSFTQYRGLFGFNYFEKSLNSIVYSVHVPLFFVICGFLCHKQNLKNYYLKKIKRVFIPFIVFSLLKIIYSNAISSSYFHGNSVTDQFVDAFVIGALYWFIYCVMLMYLVAPILWKDCGKTIPVISIIIFTVFMLINLLNTKYKFVNTSSAHNTYFQYGSFIYHMPFFVLGFLLGQIDYKKLFKKKIVYVFFLLVFVILTFLIYIKKTKISRNYFISFIYSISIMALFLWGASRIKKPVKLVQLGAKYSLQIMFLDSFYKAVIYAICEKFLFRYSFFQNFTMSIFIAVVDFLLCIFTCVILKKVKLFRFLF